jgi:hypothetical protein
VSFYIKPVDGLQLPEIMQWLKQTSTGHTLTKHSHTIPYRKKHVNTFSIFFELFFTFSPLLPKHLFRCFANMPKAVRPACR